MMWATCQTSISVLSPFLVPGYPNIGFNNLTGHPFAAGDEILAVTECRERQYMLEYAPPKDPSASSFASNVKRMLELFQGQAVRYPDKQR